MDELTRQIELVWNSPNLCQEYGLAGFEKAQREYHQDVYFKKLMGIYEQAIRDMGRNADCIGKLIENCQPEAIAVS